VVLIDTSVWIEVFRREAPLDLEEVVPFDRVVTCLPVIQEVLQGFSREADYRLARVAMASLPRVEDPMDFVLFEEAVDLYRRARRRGLTVRSSVDCLIAAAALRHDLEILHRDRDYRTLAEVCPLRQWTPTRP
jgi:predicted nucleic acid-binding protein